MTKDITTAFTPELRPLIDYIITLGGDGTLLWAAKQFNTCEMPPLITFAQGSLGFMCNFTFEDHEAVLKPILQSMRGDSGPSEIGSESRLRLKVNVGSDTTPDRQVFRGD